MLTPGPNRGGLTPGPRGSFHGVNSGDGVGFSTDAHFMALFHVKGHLPLIRPAARRINVLLKNFCIYQNVVNSFPLTITYSGRWLTLMSNTKFQTSGSIEIPIDFQKTLDQK